ncbi:hypothetical protein V5O48_004225 [Marasmius crinis-equi]|uniref:DUF6534 domain-containing protein n=1 Tax=Marasmius crinis-equi TaxID=585013 RepID=A0ABR3FQS9_9AGAR
MVNVNAPYGPTLIAIIIYAFLYGLATIQTLLFFKFNDRLHTANKVAVAILWCVQASVEPAFELRVVRRVMSGLDLAFISHFVYFYVIQADMASTVQRLQWSFVGYTAVDFSLLAFAQALYAVRLWQRKSRAELLDSFRPSNPPEVLELTNNKIFRWIISSVLAILIGISIVLAIFLPYHMATAQSGGEYNSYSRFVLFALANGSIIDWILSCTLSYGLIKAAGTNFGWTDSSLVVLLAYILNTGTLAAIFSIAAVVAYALDQMSLNFLPFKVIHVALYFNSFLAMMNARFYFQQKSENPATLHHTVSYETSDGDFYTRRHISAGSSFSSEIQGQTINEVGLPLFEGGGARTKELRGDGVKMVEIRVDKQQKQAYSRASRPLYRVARPS